MDTTKNQLITTCSRIVDEIETGKYGYDKSSSDYDEPCAADYLMDALDYTYTINSDKSYLGVKIAVSLGGPNIYINTVNKCVEGYWGDDSCKKFYYSDSLGIDDYFEELYNS